MAKNQNTLQNGTNETEALESRKFISIENTVNSLLRIIKRHSMAAEDAEDIRKACAVLNNMPYYFLQQEVVKTLTMQANSDESGEPDDLEVSPRLIRSSTDVLEENVDLIVNHGMIHNILGVYHSDLERYDAPLSANSMMEMIQKMLGEGRERAYIPVDQDTVIRAVAKKNNDCDGFCLELNWICPEDDASPRLRYEIPSDDTRSLQSAVISIAYRAAKARMKESGQLFLRYKGLDSWDRPVYEADNLFYVDMDPRKDRKPVIATKYMNTFDGEPDVNIPLDVEVIFFPRRIVWH